MVLMKEIVSKFPISTDARFKFGFLYRGWEDGQMMNPTFLNIVEEKATNRITFFEPHQTCQGGVESA